jgi:hypothetical protein
VGGQNQACSAGLIGPFRPAGQAEQGDDVVHREIGQLGKPETPLTGKPEIIGGVISRRSLLALFVLRAPDAAGRPEVQNRGSGG